MNTTDQLIVRACKVERSKSYKRLHSVYRRFYCPDPDKTQHIKYIAHILIDLCKRYKVISIEKLIFELNPSNMTFQDGKRHSYNERVVTV